MSRSSCVTRRMLSLLVAVALPAKDDAVRSLRKPKVTERSAPSCHVERGHCDVAAVGLTARLHIRRKEKHSTRESGDGAEHGSARRTLAGRIFPDLRDVGCGNRARGCHLLPAQEDRALPDPKRLKDDLVVGSERVGCPAP